MTGDDIAVVLWDSIVGLSVCVALWRDMGLLG